MWVNRKIVTVGKGTVGVIRPYRGETYFLSGSGESQLTKVSSTEIVVDLKKVSSDSWLVLNQNYFPGWKTEPRREIESKNGLLAVRILNGDTNIRIIYKPVSFVVGFWVSLICVLVSLVFFMVKSVKARNE